MAPKKRKGDGSSTSCVQGLDETLTSFMQRQSGHRMLNLSRLANVDPKDWPENKKEFYGLKLTREEKARLAKLQKRTFVKSRYACRAP